VATPRFNYGPPHIDGIQLTRALKALAGDDPHIHALTMFAVTEAQAAAIRTAYEQRGELSAAIELHRLFPGIADNAQARDCARTIAGWQPLPKRLRPARLRAGNTD
jgi:hypothetical protein